MKTAVIATVAFSTAAFALPTLGRRAPQSDEPFPIGNGTVPLQPTNAGTGIPTGVAAPTSTSSVEDVAEPTATPETGCTSGTYRCSPDATGWDVCYLGTWTNAGSCQSTEVCTFNELNGSPYCVVAGAAGADVIAPKDGEEFVDEGDFEDEDEFEDEEEFEEGEEVDGDEDELEEVDGEGELEVPEDLELPEGLEEIEIVEGGDDELEIPEDFEDDLENDGADVGFEEEEEEEEEGDEENFEDVEGSNEDTEGEEEQEEPEAPKVSIELPEGVGSPK